MKKDFLSNWRFWALISAILLGIFAVLPLLIIFALYLYERFSGIKIEKFYGIAIATVIMALIAVILIFVLPIIRYFFSKIGCYISLRVNCIKCGYQMSAKRFPFASLFGIRKKEDIGITCNRTYYCIHFVDIVFKNKRHFSIIGDNKYCITKVVPDKVVSYGKGLSNGGASNMYAYRMSAQSLEEDRERELPKVREERNTYHVIMLSQIPISTYRVTEGGAEELVSGIRINDAYIYYTRKGFITMLKRNRIK